MTSCSSSHRIRSIPKYFVDSIFSNRVLKILIDDTFIYIHVNIYIYMQYIYRIYINIQQLASNQDFSFFIYK